MGKLIKIFFVTTLIFLVFPLRINAKSPVDYGLQQQEVLPGSSGYTNKRLKEKVGMFFKFSKKSKFEYSLTLLEKRLSELTSMIEAKDPNFVIPSSQRFSYQAGITAEINKKLKEKQNDKLFSVFDKYSVVLSELRDNYPSNSPHWLVTQQNIDTLNILKEESK